ncbi:MAG TPA: carbohydrate ABC transporter substrate-binding protein [Epulopiscium sp.]|nr:carbohydrate ABC transporter substrate-binding protein [Candidatus Epulonipiscium sp.]
MRKKKFIAAIIASTMMISMALTGCGSKTATAPGGEPAGEEKVETKEKDKKKGKKLVVWTFTDEVKKMIDEHYLKDNPDLDYEIEVVIVPNEQYQSKIDPALQAGKGAPDLFAIEAAYSKKYLNSDLTMSLADLGIEDSDLDEITTYVKDVARDSNGVLKGISWQAAPGAFFYRRSLAEKYLGVSEPEDVQPLLKDYPTFLDTARKLQKESNDAVKILSGTGELAEVFYANRSQGWVVDNKLVVDPSIDEFYEVTKVLEQEGLTTEAAGWSEGWYAGMNTDKVFGYSLPTWGLHYILKENAENKEAGTTTAGDWGMVQGPGAYFWGGTWLVARQGTEMKEEAKALMTYLTLNEGFLEGWAKETGDLLSNETIVNRIKDTYEEPFLAGQNHYTEFAEMAKSVDASILTGFDLDMQTLLIEEVTAYSKGEKDKATAIADFKANVKNLFPDLDVE